MIVPVSIHYRELEELCYYDDWEKGVICDNYNAEHEYTVDEVEFDYADLKDIVEEYTDDIIDILLDDERLTKALLKKMRSRKIDAFMNDAKDEGGKALKNRKNEVTQK